ncbi:MAG: FMN-binding protein [Blautia sp.]|nr:FMN-binding protein [Blautia sp.]
MKRRYAGVLLLAGALMAAALTGCGGSKSFKDGTYEGKSSVYEGEEDGSGAGYGVAKVTISGGKITGCEFQTFEPDGTLKGPDYGKQNGEIANQDFYNKAQRAVQASTKYGEQLAEAGNLADVDAISGATISFNEFNEAVNDALDQASGK